MDYLKIIGEAVGFIALIESFFIYASLNRDTILKLKFVSDALGFINFLCLGGYTGAILNIVTMSREVVFYNRDKKKWASHIIWLPIFILFTLVSPVIEYITVGHLAPIAFLPAIGSMISVVGLYQHNTNHLRYYSFVAITLWLIYSIYLQNISASISNSIVLISIIVGTVRYFINQKKAEKKSSLRNPSVINGEKS